MLEGCIAAKDKLAVWRYLFDSVLERDVKLTNSLAGILRMEDDAVADTNVTEEYSFSQLGIKTTMGVMMDTAGHDPWRIAWW